jgi:hypothetical protein
LNNHGLRIQERPSYTMSASSTSELNAVTETFRRQPSCQLDAELYWANPLPVIPNMHVPENAKPLGPDPELDENVYPPQTFVAVVAEESAVAVTPDKVRQPARYNEYVEFTREYIGGLYNITISGLDRCSQRRLFALAADPTHLNSTTEILARDIPRYKARIATARAEKNFEAYAHMQITKFLVYTHLTADANEALTADELNERRMELARLRDVVAKCIAFTKLNVRTSRTLFELELIIKEYIAILGPSTTTHYE